MTAVPMPPSPRAAASDQIADAVNDLRRHPDAYLRWPWPSLDSLTYGMADGSVHYVVAFSGIGKTTFVSSATNLWLDQGKRVMVLPLETQPKTFRTYLACQKLGIRPGDAFSGELRRRGGPEVKQLEDELFAQIHDAERLNVKTTREITLGVFEEACEEAAAMKADAVIVDHVDHVAAGDGSNLYAESVKVNRAALRIAQEMGLVLILCSQLNNDALKGQDALAKFSPPREQHVKYGTHKREIATSMLGLYRPTRGKRADEDEERYKETMRKARQGEIEPHHALVPHTMGVVQMKDRNYGADGRRILLAVQNGRVEDREERRDDARYGI